MYLTRMPLLYMYCNNDQLSISSSYPSSETNPFPPSKLTTCEKCADTMEATIPLAFLPGSGVDSAKRSPCGEVSVVAGVWWEKLVLTQVTESFSISSCTYDPARCCYACWSYGRCCHLITPVGRRLDQGGLLSGCVYHVLFKTCISCWIFLLR